MSSCPYNHFCKYISYPTDVSCSQVSHVFRDCYSFLNCLSEGVQSEEDDVLRSVGEDPLPNLVLVGHLYN